MQRRSGPAALAARRQNRAAQARRGVRARVAGMALVAKVANVIVNDVFDFEQRTWKNQESTF